MDKSDKNPQIVVEDDRTGTSVETLRRAMADHLFYSLGRVPEMATKQDLYLAVALTVRDRLLHRWLNTAETYFHQDVRVVCYLSAEFLMGPQLANNLVNLGLYKQFDQALSESGLSLEAIIDQEEEPGLGNGGLGRLAACYLDSMATLNIAGVGYGIRYEFGIFDQEIHDGWQVEITDKWLRLGNPWEIDRPEMAQAVGFGGTTQSSTDERGRYKVVWTPAHVINGVPCDTVVPGYQTNTANTLRLWKAEARESFNFQKFNAGDYYGAVIDKVYSENVSKVLYPNDDFERGKQLRLAQQYFFVACSLKDMLRLHILAGGSVDNFHDKVTCQLNDTHPSIAIAELMRIFVDEYEMEWEKAWYITTRTFAYTNHTLLPEALERWNVELFGATLPRHLEIIYEINRRFLDEIRLKYPGDEGLVSRLSLIDDQGGKYVRMAHLACVGSYAINGVAALHTELLKKDVLSDFYRIYPEKFSNKTNGITPRRFMAVSNHELTELITSKIGDGWLSKLDELKKLEKFVDDKQFVKDWQAVKRLQKERMAEYVLEKTGVTVDPAFLFDVQAKRLHEYKRQHLNVLHIIHLYNKLKKNPHLEMTPRTFLFAGKAAPAYMTAKLIIKLITSVASVVNSDHDVASKLKVAFVPDFNVKLGQILYPAADLSEQISTAGKEASGTGNMKFALNGALTIGTLDGANIEMREEVGAENFFLFGLTADEVAHLKAHGYRPYDYYESNQDLKEVIDLIADGTFSWGDKLLFRPLVDSLLNYDPYLLLADFESYVACQEKVSDLFSRPDDWARMSILNVARMGKFSSDRSIQEYCRDIWRVSPVKVDIGSYQQSSAVLRIQEPGLAGVKGRGKGKPKPVPKPTHPSF
ncbi:MAG: glycogen/starch/alpha-glucan phosphorylase [Cyanobacteria bacterium SZAS LIN-3]|nr:glycogen/starch/alpha-glucan phosphorylase [Cyanobacteria bacterium SZAS LIN-3]